MRTRRGLLAAAALAAALAFAVSGTARSPGGRDRGAAVPPAPLRAPARPADPASFLRGIVVDGAGSPVEGAEVAAAREGARNPARAVTGADGRFLLPAASGGEEVLLGVRAPGRAPVLRGGVRPGDGDLRIVLHPGTRLRGRVRDGSGAPCAGARVRAVLRFPGVAADLGGFETRTDELGAYSFEGLPAVDGTVQARFHGSSSEPAAVSLPPGPGEVERDLLVEAGPSLEGVVRGTEGLPLEGIVVGARNLATGRGPSATTDAEGRFVLRGLDPVPHELDAADPGALRLPAAPRTATPPERGIEIAMAPNPAPPAGATFRVVDAGGGAVTAVRTLTFREGDPVPAGSGSLRADASGLFRTGRLRRGNWRIDLRCAGGTGTTGPFAVEPGEFADLGTIRLSPGASVRGRILDPSGTPSPGARVVADDGSLAEPGAVAADGTFELRGLPAGAGRIRILLAGCEVRAADWAAGPGGTADLGDLRLRAATGAVRGTVRSRSGRPVGGAGIRIAPWGDLGRGADERRIAAGPDGRFEAGALAAGRWVVSAAPSGTAVSFASDGNARRIDLGEGDQREIVLEVD